MKNLTIASFILASVLGANAAVYDSNTPQATAIASCIGQYLPGVTGFGTVRINNITTDDRARTVTVNLNEAAKYIPFTAESYEAFRHDLLQTLGRNYSGYDVVVKGDGTDLATLVLFAGTSPAGPTEREPFIVHHEAIPAPEGLDNTNITVWQSHGWYFEPKLNRWEWQRARIFQTVEDLYTQSYVMPFLMPMLENAGAYVMSPRERDTSRMEIIVDNDGHLATGTYTETGGWGDAGTGFAYLTPQLINNQNPFREGTGRKSPCGLQRAHESAAQVAPLGQRQRHGNGAVEGRHSRRRHLCRVRKLSHSGKQHLCSALPRECRRRHPPL